METAEIAAKRIEARILEIEGRRPSPEEVKMHGASAEHLDGRLEYKWRGSTIVTIHPPAPEGSGVYARVIG